MSHHHIPSNNSHNDGTNTEKTFHRPTAVRRVIAKVKNKTGISHDTKESYVNYQDDKPHPHPMVEDVVNTIGYSLIQELMQYLKGPDGEEALEIIFNEQARVGARLAMTEESKRAARVTAQEGMTGTYDGIEWKMKEMWGSLNPSLITIGGILLGSYILLLSVGMLFSLWRFAFFGLQ
jgi:hypothetical protein